MRTLTAIVLLLFATLSLAAPPATQPLAEIRSPEEVKKQPAIALPRGGSVQLGIGPLDPDLGPWRIVYAKFAGDFDHAGAGQHPVDAVSLGPLFVHCHWDDDADAAKMLQDLAKRSQQRTDPSPLLQCVVPVTRSGGGTIRVLDADGNELAALRIHVEQPVPSPWRPFAARWHDPAAPAKPSYIVRGADAPAIPRLEPMAGPVLLQQTVRPATQPDATLQLSLDNGVFTLESSAGGMLNWPDHHLLARWWVNGEPRPPRGATPAEVSMQNGRISFVDRVDVRFDLPADLRQNAKVGDRVAVQVLYSADGYRYLPQHQMQQMSQMLHPEHLALALSNTLEFVLTDDLLAAATAAREPATSPSRDHSR